MVLLMGFALLAGAATAVSPCVLPVLPIALSAGLTGGRRRPLGIVTGLAASFTFATVALVYIISALGLPGGLLRTVAIVVMITFGLMLLVPAASSRAEGWLSRLTGRVRVGQATGFWSGVLVGAGLGLLYAPCAGPILAGVITVSASQSFTAARLAVAVAYGLGSSIVLYAILGGGRKLATKLVKRTGRFQIGMGAVMVLVGGLMLANLDVRFETAIAGHLPSFLVNPTKGLESSTLVQGELTSVRGTRYRVSTAGGLAQAQQGRRLPVLERAPEFAGTERWFNTPGDRPLSLASLRGHVVLVDFWTYSCINCIRTLPYLNAWYAKYHRAGFVIVGIHTPEFPFERSASNVQAAIGQNMIRYPVAQDNNYDTWTRYRNQYWPAEYLIDGQGRVRLIAFGEGDYPVKERAIRSLLAENGAHRLGNMSHVAAQAPSAGQITPESYLGSERAEHFANGQITSGVHRYSASRSALSVNQLRYSGNWRITPTAATALSGGSLELRFRARRVFVVLGSPGMVRPVRVLLDGRPIPSSLAGSDVRGGFLRVSFDRLYRVVSLPRVQTHQLTLLFAPGVSGYSFTFG
jgi:cytochrome c biogenesis protein CcdA/thiol-disulfide isomerase/thioredoxin